ncbi:uncharacterized protein BX663DRAFT_547484 [Cokeromyces recurvatus]|uniref:uncharacterized protein n=1 Tax=Cokeromyces recurvatus TaxID=90255 RepID=UPI00221FFBF7|nr:uncharacterized protein BX663DRAFT_547484 [Cokeromyces recurvatus]KAI7907812.1 hypothetical protein BX663DRAFT_547484 [Cokeromyces recurvatus]
MPYLLNFISHIKHESLLETVTSIESNNTAIQLPFSDCTTSPGDTIEIITPSDNKRRLFVKTLIDSDLPTPFHAIYVDFTNSRYITNTERFHVFQPQEESNTLINSLDTWLTFHSDYNVRWMIIDGISHVEHVQLLKRLQVKWNFILLFLSSSSNLTSLVDYQFKFRREGEVDRLMQ